MQPPASRGLLAPADLVFAGACAVYGETAQYMDGETARTAQYMVRQGNSVSRLGTLLGVQCAVCSVQCAVSSVQ